jgi:hypothetical protein
MQVAITRLEARITPTMSAGLIRIVFSRERGKT